jgi:hypothetical protein
MPPYRPDNFVNIRCSFGCLAVLLLLGAPLLTACSPEIGDGCGTALDCSASGTRLCDLTQPSGYCTLDGCEADTCPSESVCVQFGRRVDDVSIDRLNRTFCMYKCDSSNDCREGDGYACFLAACPKGAKCSADELFGAGGEATILGPESQKFCAAKPLKPGKEPHEDAGMSMPVDEDAGMSTLDDAGTSMPEDAAMSMPDAAGN